MTYHHFKIWYSAEKNMSAEPLSASLVNRFAVPKPEHYPDGYYRSKLFVNSTTTNPLLSAAGPIFSLLERLCVSPTLPPIHHIRHNIEHEINAFHSRLISQDYAEEFIVISRYLLSATVDELIGKNYLRVYQKPAEFKAFTPPSAEMGPEKRFFDIVLHLKERANQYLDLIELSYYCLIAGFEGEHHFKSDGRQSLDNLIEELYQLILRHRVNKPLKLFKDKIDGPPPMLSNKPILTIALCTLGLLITFYTTSHVVLEYKAKNLLSGHPILSSMER